MRYLPSGTAKIGVFVNEKAKTVNSTSKNLILIMFSCMEMNLHHFVRN